MIYGLCVLGGILLGGAATARFPKLFAWFAKQDASVGKKLP